jgi:hypothetical protein
VLEEKICGGSQELSEKIARKQAALVQRGQQSFSKARLARTCKFKDIFLYINTLN